MNMSIAVPHAVRAPVKAVGLGFIISYALVFIAFWMALLLPSIMTVALRVSELDPANKEKTLALIMGVGAVVAMLANPIAGQLSDRTRSAWGMRRPWLLVGMLLGVGGQYMMATGGLWVFAIGWWTVQIGFNVAMAALMAVLPDQVPEHQRGVVSGVTGMGLQVGILAGLLLVERINADPFWMFMLPAALFVAAMLLFVLVLDDRRQTAVVPPFSLASFARGFWIDPRKAPDFAWAFLSRFLMWSGLATLTTYQVFFLLDVLKVPGDRIPAVMLTATIYATVASVVASLVSGWLSDRLRRRKVFVCFAAVVYAVGLCMVATAASLDMFYGACCVAGVGMGTYLAVDAALVTQVLPNPDNAAKGLGIFNLANTLPQTIAPAIAPVFLGFGVAAGGVGNYAALFSAAAIWSVLGAAVILFVRKVK